MFFKKKQGRLEGALDNDGPLDTWERFLQHAIPLIVNFPQKRFLMDNFTTQLCRLRGIDIHLSCQWMR